MIIAFTDGSSSKKQKTFGCGYTAIKNPKIDIFIESEQKFIIKEKVGFKNSFKTGASELIAVLFLLWKLKDESLQNEVIILYSDSQYVVNELASRFRDHIVKHFIDIKNKGLIIRILYELKDFNNIKIKWTKGHRAITDFAAFGNDIADKLSVSAHKGKEIDIEKDLFDFDEFVNNIEISNNNEDVFKSIYKFYIQ